MARMTLDDLIASRAKIYAQQLTAAAQRATKEEEIRIASERELGSIQDAAGIKLEGRHEFTVASGFVDSVYDRVLIEYKNPSSQSAKIGPTLDSPGTRKVVEQIKSRFRDMRLEHGQPLNSLFGVGLDGRYFVFVRFRDGQCHVQEPMPVTQYSAEKFLWALFNLGTKGKPFTPTELARDFGADAPFARSAVKGLYETLLTAGAAAGNTGDLETLEEKVDQVAAEVLMVPAAKLKVMCDELQLLRGTVSSPSEQDD